MLSLKVYSSLRDIYLYFRGVFQKADQSPVQLRLRDLGYLLQFVKPVRKLYLVCISLTIAGSLLRSVLPMNGKLFIDFVATDAGYSHAEQLFGPLYSTIASSGLLGLFSSLYFLVAATLAVGLAASLMGIGQQYVLQKAGQELTLSIESSLFNRVLRFPMTYLKNRQTGYLTSRISGDVRAVQSMLDYSVSLAFSSVFSAMFSIALIFALNARLALLLSLLIPANVLINGFFSRRLRSVSRNERENDAQVNRDMQEILSGVEVVKTYSTEDEETRKVTAKLRVGNAIKLKSLLISSFSSFFVGGTQSLISLVIMVIAAGEIAGGAMTIGDYFAFTSYAIILTGALTSLLGIQLRLQPMLASLERLHEMFSVAPETDRAEGAKGSLQRLSGRAEFKDVSFSYDGLKPVLDQVSFTVSPGEMVALVGRSGAGKTTIVNLLLKFYTPGAGGIFVDGRDLQSLDARGLRNQISMVSQDIFLFSDTIENNIKYGNSRASRRQVEEAARKAHIHDYILSLPLQYDTVVGEKGAGLSIGQRQRISLARAFLKDAPILVLDEPTSAMDTLTEAQLRDSLSTLAKNKAVIVVSHRLFICDMATRILVLKEGKIIERGTHEELLRSGREYPAIYYAGERPAVVVQTMAKPPSGGLSS